MTKRSRAINRTLNSALGSAYKATDKAATGLFRYATTDHTGLAKRLSNVPTMGLGVGDTLKYIFLQMLISILAAAATGALMGLMIGCGIPYLCIESLPLLKIDCSRELDTDISEPLWGPL